MFHYKLKMRLLTLIRTVEFKYNIQQSFVKMINNHIDPVPPFTLLLVVHDVCYDSQISQPMGRVSWFLCCSPVGWWSGGRRRRETNIPDARSRGPSPWQLARQQLLMMKILWCKNTTESFHRNGTELFGSEQLLLHRTLRPVLVQSDRGNQWNWHEESAGLSETWYRPEFKNYQVHDSMFRIVLDDSDKTVSVRNQTSGSSTLSEKLRYHKKLCVQLSGSRSVRTAQ